jgi:hypothetical protein
VGVPCTGGATPHPVKLVHSPEGLHLTVASAPSSGGRSSDAAAVDDGNHGDNDTVGLRIPLARRTGSQTIVSHPSAQRQSDTNVNSNAYALDAPDAAMDATCAYFNQGRAQESREEEELHGINSFPSAQENNTFGAAQAANNSHVHVAAICKEIGLQRDSGNTHAAKPTENGADVAPPSVCEKGTILPKKERSPTPSGTCGQVSTN